MNLFLGIIFVSGLVNGCQYAAYRNLLTEYADLESQFRQCCFAEDAASLTSTLSDCSFYCTIDVSAHLQRLNSNVCNQLFYAPQGISSPNADIFQLCFDLVYQSMDPTKVSKCCDQFNSGQCPLCDGLPFGINGEGAMSPDEANCAAFFMNFQNIVICILQ